MDEPAEPVTAAHPGPGSWTERDRAWRGFGCAKFERSVWALAVVVLDVLAEDVIEVAPAENEQRVQALLAQRAHEALSVRVGVRRPERGAYHPDPLGPEDLLEGRAELRIAIVDQEARRLLRPHMSIMRLRAC